MKTSTPQLKTSLQILIEKAFTKINENFETIKNKKPFEGKSLAVVIWKHLCEKLGNDNITELQNYVSGGLFRDLPLKTSSTLNDANFAPFLGAVIWKYWESLGTRKDFLNSFNALNDKQIVKMAEYMAVALKNEIFLKAVSGEKFPIDPRILFGKFLLQAAKFELKGTEKEPELKNLESSGGYTKLEVALIFLSETPKFNRFLGGEKGLFSTEIVDARNKLALEAQQGHSTVDEIEHPLQSERADAPALPDSLLSMEESSPVDSEEPAPVKNQVKNRNLPPIWARHTKASEIKQQPDKPTVPTQFEPEEKPASEGVVLGAGDVAHSSSSQTKSISQQALEQQRKLRQEELYAKSRHLLAQRVKQQQEENAAKQREREEAERALKAQQHNAAIASFQQRTKEAKEKIAAIWKIKKEQADDLKPPVTQENIVSPPEPESEIQRLDQVLNIPVPELIKSTKLKDAAEKASQVMVNRQKEKQEKQNVDIERLVTQWNDFCYAVGEPTKSVRSQLSPQSNILALCEQYKNLFDGHDPEFQKALQTLRAGVPSYINQLTAYFYDFFENSAVLTKQLKEKYKQTATELRNNTWNANIQVKQKQVLNNVAQSWADLIHWQIEQLDAGNKRALNTQIWEASFVGKDLNNKAEIVFNFLNMVNDPFWNKMQTFVHKKDEILAVCLEKLEPLLNKLEELGNAENQQNAKKQIQEKQALQQDQVEVLLAQWRFWVVEKYQLVSHVDSGNLVALCADYALHSQQLIAKMSKEPSEQHTLLSFINSIFSVAESKSMTVLLPFACQMVLGSLMIQVNFLPEPEQKAWKETLLKLDNWPSRLNALMPLIAQPGQEKIAEKVQYIANNFDTNAAVRNNFSGVLQEHSWWASWLKKEAQPKEIIHSDAPVIERVNNIPTLQQVFSPVVDEPRAGDSLLVSDEVFSPRVVSRPQEQEEEKESIEPESKIEEIEELVARFDALVEQEVRAEERQSTPKNRRRSVQLIDDKVQLLQTIANLQTRADKDNEVKLLWDALKKIIAVRDRSTPESLKNRRQSWLDRRNTPEYHLISIMEISLGKTYGKDKIKNMFHKVWEDYNIKEEQIPQLISNIVGTPLSIRGNPSQPRPPLVPHAVDNKIAPPLVPLVMPLVAEKSFSPNPPPPPPPPRFAAPASNPLAKRTARPPRLSTILENSTRETVLDITHETTPPIQDDNQKRWEEVKAHLKQNKILRNKYKKQGLSESDIDREVDKYLEDNVYLGNLDTHIEEFGDVNLNLPKFYRQVGVEKFSPDELTRRLEQSEHIEKLINAIQEGWQAWRRNKTSNNLAVVLNDLTILDAISKDFNAEVNQPLRKQVTECKNTVTKLSNKLNLVKNSFFIIQLTANIQKLHTLIKNQQFNTFAEETVVFHTVHTPKEEEEKVAMWENPLRTQAINKKKEKNIRIATLPPIEEEKEDKEASPSKELLQAFLNSMDSNVKEIEARKEENTQAIHHNISLVGELKRQDLLLDALNDKERHLLVLQEELHGYTDTANGLQQQVELFRTKVAAEKGKISEVNALLDDIHTLLKKLVAQRQALDSLTSDIEKIGQEIRHQREKERSEELSAIYAPEPEIQQENILLNAKHKRGVSPVSVDQTHFEERNESRIEVLQERREGINLVEGQVEEQPLLMVDRVDVPERIRSRNCLAMTCAVMAAPFAMVGAGLVITGMACRKLLSRMAIPQLSSSRTPEAAIYPEEDIISFNNPMRSGRPRPTVQARREPNHEQERMSEGLELVERRQLSIDASEDGVLHSEMDDEIVSETSEILSEIDEMMSENQAIQEPEMVNIINPDEEGQQVNFVSVDQLTELENLEFSGKALEQGISLFVNNIQKSLWKVLKNSDFFMAMGDFARQHGPYRSGNKGDEKKIFAMLREVSEMLNKECTLDTLKIVNALKEDVAHLQTYMRLKEKRLKEAKRIIDNSKEAMAGNSQLQKTYNAMWEVKQKQYEKLNDFWEKEYGFFKPEDPEENEPSSEEELKAQYYVIAEAEAKAKIKRQPAQVIEKLMIQMKLVSDYKLTVDVKDKEYDKDKTSRAVIIKKEEWKNFIETASQNSDSDTVVLAWENATDNEITRMEPTRISESSESRLVDSRKEVKIEYQYGYNENNTKVIKSVYGSSHDGLRVEGMLRGSEKNELDRKMHAQMALDMAIKSLSEFIGNNGYKWPTKHNRMVLRVPSDAACMYGFGALIALGVDREAIKLDPRSNLKEYLGKEIPVPKKYNEPTASKSAFKNSSKDAAIDVDLRHSSAYMVKEFLKNLMGSERLAEVERLKTPKELAKIRDARQKVAEVVATMKRANEIEKQSTEGKNERMDRYVHVNGLRGQ